MMKRYSWYDDAAIGTMSTVIKGGGLLVGSSDTVFGFLASATAGGKTRLDQIKGRQDKPYLVLAGSIEEVQKLVNEPQLLQVEKLLEACWPGPLTVIFEPSAYAKKCYGVVSLDSAKKVTIAIRVPKHAGLQKLLALTGPLFSTSANKTGQPVPATLAAMDPSILVQVDAVVLDGDSQESTLSTPSTLIDATSQKLVLVREGAYAKADLESIIDKRGGKGF